MKHSFIIGIVWMAIIVGIISFGATVFLLDSDTKQATNTESVESAKKQMIYEIDQSSIRTNQLANNDVTKNNNSQSDIRNLNLGEGNQNQETKNKQKKTEEIVEKDIQKESNKINEVNSHNTFIRPVKGEGLKPFSSDELLYSKTLNEWNVHLGTDFKAKLGDEVLAVQNGKIKKIDSNDKYGEFIIVEHKSGYESLYSNITVLDACKEGSEVEQGEVLGYVAESFGFEVEEETHLHFELKKDDKYIGI